MNAESYGSNKENNEWPGNNYARLVGILLSEQMQIKIVLEIFCKFVGESRDKPCNDVSATT